MHTKDKQTIKSAGKRQCVTGSSAGQFFPDTQSHHSGIKQDKASTQPTLDTRGKRYRKVKA